MNMHTLLLEMSEKCYIARDLNSALYLFETKPKEACGEYVPSGDSQSVELNNGLFKSVSPGTCYELNLSYKLVKVIDNG